MRNLRQNMQTIQYQLATGEWEYETDDNNLYTGTKIPGYGEVKDYKINIRINRGGIWLRDYGISTEFDGIMETNDRDCPIVENTLIYYLNRKFVVSRVDITLNTIKYYLAEVK